MNTPEARWVRIIPAAFLMYTIAYIDRTNFSLAIPALQREFHLSAELAGTAGGVFFFGYFLFQVPGGFLAQIWSAKRFVFAALLVWGVFAALCGLAQTPGQLLFFRFCLGLGEGGVWPATVVLLTNWFPRGERARANGYWVLCQPAAVIVSSPLSGWLLDHFNWRVMFIAQGMLPIAFAAIWWKAVEDTPSQAKWLSSRERQEIASQVAQDAISGPRVNVQEGRWRFLRDFNIAAFALLDIAFACGAYGLLMWLPSAVMLLHARSNVAVGAIAALPYAFACVGSVYNSRHSDQSDERRWHIAVPCIAAGITLLLGSTVGSHSPILAMVLLCATGFSVYASLGPMWALMTEIVPVASAGMALGLINGFANLGGFIGPYLVGRLKDSTHGFYAGFVFLSACLVAAGMIALFVKSPRRAVLTATES